jgi:iron complex outermembrane recepter protein
LISASGTQDTSFSRNYGRFFPSAALTVDFGKNMGLNLTYSRRIDRPSYQDLNPFEYKLDELTFQKGNFMLRPQFTNSFEISPTYSGYPVLTLGYSHTEDVFTQILRTSTTNLRATYITQDNLANQDNWSLSLNFPTPINKWWDGFVSLTGIRSHFTADFGDNFKIDQSFLTGNIYAEQNFKLPKKFALQISGWGNTKGFWGTFSSTPQGEVSLGMSKKVLKDNGEIRVNVGDLFYTTPWGGENVFTPGLYMTARGGWESQTVRLSFNYKFGNNDLKAANQRKSGADSERNRVKG